MFMNHLTHRKGKMDQQEDDVPEVRDDSRPFLQRSKGELGIYIDPLDAEPMDSKSFGLEHCFMMVLRENFQDHLYNTDLVKLKGELEHRGLFTGCVLEEVRKGMILLVTFDDFTAIDSLWNLFEKKKLSSLFQDLLVNKDALERCQVKKLTIRAKIWEDEYLSCKDEILTRKSDRVLLTNFKNDIRILKEIRECQKKLGEDTLKMRDIETAFEQQIEDFMIAVKRIMPPDATVINNLDEFYNCVKVAKGVRKTGFNEIDSYLNSLGIMQGIFRDVELDICCRLSQIHGVCETETQRDMKQNIKTMRKEMEDLLKPDNNLLFVRFNDWDCKINPREKKMFFGLVSLIPIGLECLVDIDHTIDEFITAFPELAST